MGAFVNPGWVKALAWAVAVIIAVLNVWLLYQTFVGPVDWPLERACTERILVAVENSAADRTILAHVARARAAHRRRAAARPRRRRLGRAPLRRAEAARVGGDEGRPRVSRAAARASSTAQGLTRRHAAGDGRSGDRADPRRRRRTRRSDRDVHARPPVPRRLLHGTTADRVRHLVKVPVLLLRAQ